MGAKEDEHCVAGPFPTRSGSNVPSRILRVHFTNDVVNSAARRRWLLDVSGSSVSLKNGDTNTGSGQRSPRYLRACYEPDSCAFFKKAAMAGGGYEPCALKPGSGPALLVH